MKKKGLIRFIVLLLGAGVLFTFLTIKKSLVIQRKLTNTEDCVRRHFINKVLWQKINMGKQLNDSTFLINNNNFTITKVLFNGFNIIVSNNTDSLNGIVNFEGTTEPLTCNITFSSTKNSETGIFSGYKYSNIIKKFEPSINIFMSSFENYFNSPQKVYGFNVKLERTTDFNLLVYKQQLKQEPTVQEIYNTIEKIGNYINTKNGEIKNSPMLNIYKEDSTVYDVMVALPTKQPIDGNNDINYKKLVDGNILVAEVKGGFYTIKQAEKEMKNYVEDTKRTSPAIPYQSLITNRLTETDTTKWVTKLYYPVFY